MVHCSMLRRIDKTCNEMNTTCEGRMEWPNTILGQNVLFRGISEIQMDMVVVNLEPGMIMWMSQAGAVFTVVSLRCIDKLSHVKKQRRPGFLSVHHSLNSHQIYAKSSVWRQTSLTSEKKPMQISL